MSDEINLIDITGIDKAELLAGLFNASQQIGMGFLDERGKDDITPRQAKRIIDDRLETFGFKAYYFDYLHGRFLKVGIGGDSFNPAAFNRVNGERAAEFVVQGLRLTKKSTVTV